MSFSQRLKEIREGFEPAFWVANFTEIFERVAYYGTTAVLAIYLNEQLHFSNELTGWLHGHLRRSSCGFSRFSAALSPIASAFAAR